MSEIVGVVSLRRSSTTVWFDITGEPACRCLGEGGGALVNGKKVGQFAGMKVLAPRLWREDDMQQMPHKCQRKLYFLFQFILS